MSTLHSAHDFSIGTLNIHLGSPTWPHALTVLQQHVASGATNSSAERCDAPKCIAETRVATVQEEILSWIMHGDRDAQPKCIMWVTGPAGTGKTAILGSVADVCQERDALAASFFFSGYPNSPVRRSKKWFVGTFKLAYELLQHDAKHFGCRMLTAINKDPRIFDNEKGAQVAGWPQAIVIDGLDECDAEQYHDHQRHPHLTRSKEDDQVEILSLLTHAVNDPTFPFRILIASRPERVITGFFSTHVEELAVKLVLDEKYNPDADIALFLRAKFAEMRRRYNLPGDWSSEEDIELLVENASGQFIYVAAVIRFVEKAANPPPIQLDIVLNLPTVKAALNPFAPLDALYTHILQTSPNPFLSVKWLYVIQTHIQWRPRRRLRDGQNVPLPASFINAYLSSSHGEAEHLLGPLTSLVYIQEPGDTVAPYKFYHKSLVDCLENRERGGQFVPGEENLAFYNERYLLVSVVRNKGPSLKVSPDELDTFFNHFFLLYPTIHWSIIRRSEREFLPAIWPGGRDTFYKP